MGVGRNWTAEEYAQLDEEWGQTSIARIAERHNRSVNAILIKAQRQGLGSHLQADDKVSINQIFRAFKVSSYGYLLGRMIRAGLKVRYHRVNNCRFKVVKIEDFWEFIEKNQSMLDFSKLEKNILGEEPAWVAKARCEDYKRRCSVKPHNCKWTPADDAELLRLVRMQKYSYAEIGKQLQRTCGAVSRRLHDLGVKDRPVKADNHSKWTPEELKTLCDMIKAGSNYVNISEVLGKSAKAVQGRVYQMYLTERLDKVREMLNGGEWGEGRPDKPLKNKNSMNAQEKREMNAGLGELVCLLTYRADQLARLEKQYGWQRNQCEHWHNGCDAVDQNCDTCTHFRRKESI